MSSEKWMLSGRIVPTDITHTGTTPDLAYYSAFDLACPKARNYAIANWTKRSLRKETPAQYTERILNNVKKEDALKIQKGTPAKIARALRGLSSKQMMKRPGRDQWSIGEILAHLAEAELVSGYRVRTILGANGAPIQAFDQDVWAKNADYAHQDPDRSLKAFRALRKYNLRFLKAIPDKSWSNYGMHEERGRETIERLARMMAGHDINHLRQIEGMAKKLNA